MLFCYRRGTIYSVSYPQDTTCNLEVVFLVFYQTERMSQLGISCSLCSHERECQSKNLLKKEAKQFQEEFGNS